MCLRFDLAKTNAFKRRLKKPITVYKYFDIDSEKGLITPYRGLEVDISQKEMVSNRLSVSLTPNENSSKDISLGIHFYLKRDQGSHIEVPMILKPEDFIATNGIHAVAMKLGWTKEAKKILRDRINRKDDSWKLLVKYFEKLDKLVCSNTKVESDVLGEITSMDIGDDRVCVEGSDGEQYFNKGEDLNTEEDARDQIRSYIGNIKLYRLTKKGVPKL